MTWRYLSEFTHLGVKPLYLEIVTTPVWAFHFILFLIHPVDAPHRFTVYNLLLKSTLITKKVELYERGKLH